MANSNYNFGQAIKLMSLKETLKDPNNAQHLETPDQTKLPSPPSYVSKYVLYDSQNYSPSFRSQDPRSEWSQSPSPDHKQTKLLEQRIVQKDELLSEMSKIQAELHKKLDSVNFQLVSEKSAKDKAESEARMYREEHSKLKAINKSLKRKLAKMKSNIAHISNKENQREQEIISLQQERIQLLKSPDLYSKTTSPDIYSKTTSPNLYCHTERARSNKSPIDDESSRVLEFLKRELPINSISKLPKAIILLKQQAEKYVYVRTFHQKASTLYAKLHPNDPKPTLNSLWKWLKSKSKNSKSPTNSSEMTEKIKSLLKVSDLREAFLSIDKLLKNH